VPDIEPASFRQTAAIQNVMPQHSLKHILRHTWLTSYFPCLLQARLCFSTVSLWYSF